nr:hypothetical protein [Morchella crassipes]
MLPSKWAYNGPKKCCWFFYLSSGLLYLKIFPPPPHSFQPPPNSPYMGIPPFAAQQPSCALTAQLFGGADEGFMFGGGIPKLSGWGGKCRGGKVYWFQVGF